MKVIIPTAEPFLYSGGPIGCLLIHGFTGTPKEMRPLGEHLAQAGHTVLGVRLTGHATDLDDLRRARYPDWIADVEGGYHMLRSNCSQIVVMGLSMGGILAMMMAAQHPVAGVVAMATPYKLQSDPRLPFAKPLSLIMRDVPKGPRNWDDRKLERDHISYPAYPTRGVAELRDLIQECRQVLPRISVPILLIYSQDDQSVPPANAKEIHARVASKDKQILWLKKSSHQIARDSEREDVFDAAAEFVGRITGETH
jgi:carboxylesterase